ncbi:hypothetical protein PFFVO_06130, partial [Plasmodium falciparum Vietnam Oak-Knoll (FVO)]
MAPPGDPQGGGTKDDDAKHMFDRIGGTIQKQVHNAAEEFRNELQGRLSSATNINLKLIGNIETCSLEYKYYKHPNGGGDVSDKRYPCKELSRKYVDRFSDKIGGQCTNEKMRRDGIGACAPYRRLHLCHHNLETIETNNYESNNAKHNLLVDVCMAAKYEGDSIKTYYTGHQHKYDDSQLCTVLARSFADIGDIVRGKDLFYGNTQEKEKREDLENKLKDIFKKIHSGLTGGVKARYKDTTNFYELREDWWTANRETVWKAITCDAHGTYFRATCGGDNESPSMAKNNCRCQKKDGRPDDQVPTYFDYVPQFLRWFEEWAEDFCRLRKHKLKDAIQKCREKHKGAKKLYCDLNRYDCEQTASGKHDFFEEDDCKGCQYSCARFVNWIDNQKKEFLKQKKKYGTEISLKSRKKRDAGGISTKVYDGYEKKFYEKLKSEYRTVGEFLGLLNNEKTCKEVKDDKEGKIDFKTVNSGSASGDDVNKTFYRTKYCEACPWCGAEQERNGVGWKAKDDRDCSPGNDYTKYKKKEIPILTGDKTKSEIVERYRKFCKNNGKNGANGREGGVGGSENGAASNSDNATTGYCGGGNSDSSLCEKWTCYYYKKKENNDGKDINFCVQGAWQNSKKDQKVKSYNAFFWDWVHDMLIDSIKWRNEHGKCINKDNGKTCIKGCKSKCDCFLKWVQQKEKEWKLILEHFNTQEGFDKGEHQRLGFTHDVVLNYLLDKKELLKIIEGTYGNTEETKHIKEMLDKEEKDAGGTGVASGTGPKNIMDKLIEHELQEAKKCKDCQEPQQSLGRSLNPHVVDDDGSPKKRDKRTNPCYSDTTTEYAVLAGKVAQKFQGEVRAKMLERSRKNGETKSSLEGDIKKAQFKNGRSGSELNGDICKIDNKYSNDIRGSTAGGPCTGKDGGNERFNAGTKWEGDNFVSATHKNLYIPPRRQHMCTSNLEKLDFLSVTSKSNVNDSFLGDVLLAANNEAQRTKDHFAHKKDDHGIACRSVRYSFADLADIIRGRDMWDKDDGAQKMEDIFKKIFGNLYESLPGIKGKYDGDDQRTPQYKQLREDWWEANRDQVWKAMVCEKDGIKCDEDPTPVDDYIPQRLRWMTEWAEWYCKVQSQEYDELLKKCGSCKIKGKVQGCTSGDSDCTPCAEACTTYGQKIKPWEDQWNNMLLQYTLLYWQAETTARYGGTRAYSGDVGDKDKPVVQFLEELQKQNSGKTTYNTAAGYIHQEARVGECEVQKYFCNTNGNQDKYVFREKPKDHDEACKCKDRPQQSAGGGAGARSLPSPRPVDSDDDHSSEDEDEEEEDDEDGDGAEDENDEPASEEVKDDTEDVVEETAVSQPAAPTTTTPGVTPACEIVKDLFEKPKNTFKEACTQKYGGNNSRLGWKCIPTSGGDKAATRGSGDTTKQNDSEGSEGEGSHQRAKRHTSDASGEKSAKSGEPTGGSICIPPRRRKLYVGGLTKWAEIQSSQSQALSGQTTPAGTPSQAQDPLLAAFVESAAVETFFLWDRYKKLNAPQSGSSLGGGAPLQLLNGAIGSEETPETSLKSGTIPPDFLRLMFYTLGDYRDICVGVKQDVIKALEASGDNKSSKNPMQEISSKIEEILKNGGTPPPTPVTHSPSSGTTPSSWWKTNGQHIWKGMICALTYKESGEKKIEQVKATDNTDLFEKLKDKYSDYDK